MDFDVFCLGILIIGLMCLVITGGIYLFGDIFIETVDCNDFGCQCLENCKLVSSWVEEKGHWLFFPCVVWIVYCLFESTIKKLFNKFPEFKKKWKDLLSNLSKNIGDFIWTLIIGFMTIGKFTIVSYMLYGFYIIFTGTWNLLNKCLGCICCIIAALVGVYLIGRLSLWFDNWLDKPIKKSKLRKRR